MKPFFPDCPLGHHRRRSLNGAAADKAPVS
jgi:hypothetical protein